MSLDEQITDQPPSVKDSIREAIESLAPDEPEETEVVEEPTEPDAPVEEPEAEEPADEPEEEPDDPDEAAKELEEPAETVLAPASWTKEEREVFAKLDPDAQKIVSRRENERTAHLREKGAEIAPLRSVAEENKAYFQQIGLAPEQSFRVLVETEKMLRFGTPQQKADMLQKIARDYGIAQPEAPAAQEEDLDADPTISRLEQRITERLGTIESQLTSRQQADESAQEREAQATATRFFEELEGMDPKEAPEVRYVEQVMPRFQSMVAEDRRNGAPLDVAALKSLYRDAAWSLPQVRDAMQNDIATAAKAAEKPVKRTIKKVSSSASGGSGVVAHSEDMPKTMSVRESVQRAVRALEDKDAGTLR